MQKDFDDFVEQIDQDDMNTILTGAERYSPISQRQMLYISLELLRRYDTWKAMEED